MIEPELSAEARQFQRIKAARDHHDSTCPLGSAIEVHMNPFDLRRMDWEEGDEIAGLLLVSNDRVQPDFLRILCAGEQEKTPKPGTKVKSLPQPKVIEVPDFAEHIINDPKKQPVYASGQVWKS